ncbi:hypothetical protein GGR50DRAFT_680278 [Xylaria sp. CBS 124048]|nr:hypothetical protein GGR50DRAFT_680278 [Xylaria sp. CBS 124048]
MHSHIGHVHTSRRAPLLADNDIDHEIGLVNHDEDDDDHPANPRRPWSVSVGTNHLSQSAEPSTSHQPLTQSDSHAPLTQPTSEDRKSSGDREQEVDPSRILTQEPENGIESPNSARNSSSTRGNGTPETFNGPSTKGREPPGRLSTSREPESEIDILYENQRGGFLCGIPLFSSAALGNLDPPAWTNYAHKPSPTDIHNAQVPDPSWQWVWPEWRINHDEQIQTDSDGWEYSFMFSKKFSWHPPKWYNSFVRRRTWIRRRIKTHLAYRATYEPPMNEAYFSILPKKRDPSPFGAASDLERTSMDRYSRRSQEDSRISGDRSKRGQENSPLPLQIKTTEDLLAVLGKCRIDRERLEAIENYIYNCTDDLGKLQYHMHEIMSLFVFQTSRKTLLTRLIQLHDNVTSAGAKGKSVTTTKAENLAASIEHADEEVRKLEYWSDIKGMAERGESARAVDNQTGWDSGWKGLDKSGPRGIKEDEHQG